MLFRSNMVAMYIINYNMSGYTSRMEALKMLDVLRDGFVKAIELLTEQTVKTFIVGA